MNNALAVPVPGACPSCQGPLHVERLRCDACQTEVNGVYAPCVVCALDPDSRRLVELFLRARGNLKDVQKELGVSYPTARQRMDAAFARMEQSQQRASPMSVLQRLRAGEITVDDAERMLRNRGR